MLYVFFWVIPRLLNFICRRFGTLCLFHLHRQIDMKNLHTYLPMKMEQSVPKRWHIKFRPRGITQKKTYNNMKGNFMKFCEKSCEATIVYEVACTVWIAFFTHMCYVHTVSWEYIGIISDGNCPSHLLLPCWLDASVSLQLRFFRALYFLFRWRIIVPIFSKSVSSCPRVLLQIFTFY
jgi:hypothetical protein